MYSGTIIINNVILNNKKTIMAYDLSDPNISNFKNKVAGIFQSNCWDIELARFQKSGSGKLFAFDQMGCEEFVFTTVNVFLNLNI